MFRLLVLFSVFLTASLAEASSCVCSASGSSRDEALNNYYYLCQSTHKDCRLIDDQYICANQEVTTETLSNNCGVTVQQQFRGAFLETAASSSSSSERISESSTASIAGEAPRQADDSTSERQEVTEVQTVSEGFSVCCFSLSFEGEDDRRVCLVLKGEYALNSAGMSCSPLG